MDTNMILLVILTVNVLILVLCLVIITRLRIVKYLLEQPVVKKLSSSTKLRPYKMDKNQGRKTHSRSPSSNKDRGDKNNRNKVKQNRNPRQVARNERPKQVTMTNQTADHREKPSSIDSTKKPEKPKTKKIQQTDKSPVEKNKIGEKDTRSFKDKAPDVKGEEAASQEQIKHGRKTRVVQKPVFTEKTD